MSTEARASALKNALVEIQNVCPEVTSSFIFSKDTEILAQDPNTSPESLKNVLEALQALTQKADIVGGVEFASFMGSQARMNIVRFEDFYVANLASFDVDEKTLTNLTKIMIPTTLKLVHDIYPSQNLAETTPPVPTRAMTIPARAPETVSAEPQARQVTVENLGLGAFLKDPDLILVDTALIAEWGETFGDNQVNRVSLEDPVSHKTLSCSFKAFTETKHEGKGLVLLSEKTRLSLNVHKGSQILIKPVLGAPEINPSSTKVSGKPIEKVIAANAALIGETRTFVPHSPDCQLIVEESRSIGGFLGNSEFARIDVGVLARWNEILGDKQIEQISIQDTVTGKNLRCKFKLIKGSENEGKGIIQLPEKIREELRTKKGALVVVKPVVK